jgi:hypothetical protein
LSNHCQRVCCTFSKICTRFDAFLLFPCQIHHKIASGLIQNSK